MNDVSAVVTHPNFLRMMEKMQALPESERQKEAERIAQVGTLRGEGVPIPRGFRVSTRTFESPDAAKLGAPAPGAVGISPAAKKLTVCGSVGGGIVVQVCATVGGEV
jgi:hypothetical protein